MSRLPLRSKRAPLAAALSGAALAVLLPLGASAETFFDLGLHSTELSADYPDGTRTATTDSSLHLGIGARRSLPRGGDIGVRLELDTIDSDLFVAIRAFDYRFHFSDRIALTGFFGAARLDTGDAAIGYYGGVGVELKELLSEWGLTFDFRIGDSLARDNVLPTDRPVTGPRPDTFYDTVGISLYLSRGFGGER